MADDSNSTYRYSPLTNTNTIRLIQLQPGFKFSPLKVKLHAVDFTDPNAPPYEAISYVWGTEAIRHPLLVDGSILKITTNLKEALEAFRLQDEPRELWADAVCINQHDLEERAQQVRIMWSIYEKASHCLVWLGRFSNDALSAINFMRDLEHMLQQQRSIHREKIVLKKDSDSTENAGRMELSLVISANEAAVLAPVTRFFDRPYFSRMWIVQEVNACPNVTAFCGTYQIDWALIALTAQWIGAEHYSNKKQQVQNLASTMGWRNAGNMCLFPRRFPQASDTLALLHTCRAFNAKESLDKIYALMGFEATKNSLSTIKIDYTVTRKQLYTEVAKAIFKQSSTLQLLSYVQAEQQPDDLPSWVPRWDQLPDSTIYMFGTSSKYNAVPNSVAKLDFPSEFVLQTTGRSVDAVAKVSPVGWEEISSTVSVHTTLMAPDISTWFFGGISNEKLLSEMIFALTADLDEDGHRVDTKLDREKHLSQFSAWYRLLRIPGIRKFDPFPGLEREVPPSRMSRDWEAYQTAAFAASKGRSIFLTKAGRFGLGPINTRPGDVVCVLDGATAPYLLTPIDDHFSAVGEAYVHGMMDGQALEQGHKYGVVRFDIF